MKTISYKRTTAADVWQAFSAIAVGLAILGCCFAWATDPRPVQGSQACTAALEAGSDCKAPLWRW